MTLALFRECPGEIKFNFVVFDIFPAKGLIDTKRDRLKK
jgi:hypothetical protein